MVFAVLHITFFGLFIRSSRRETSTTGLEKKNSVVCCGRQSLNGQEQTCLQLE